ncbi:MAG: site-specific integrase [Clostridiales Family XIII bacterium]|jgi:site-specific recombinase XerD|nr:site-specific integrase [Clostridiales Family XIII bacterium]
MKITKFAFYLNKYFTNYLPNDRGSSPQTIDAYRFSFVHFLTFLQEEFNIIADKVEITDLTYDNIIKFLNWLQIKRHNSISTRNQRQSAINSFIRFLMYEFPEHINEYQRILSIPIKHGPRKEVTYLKLDGIKLMMNMIDLHRPNGLRDYVMISLMYTTGIRVSELIQIRNKDFSLHEPYTLLVHGKGQKSRYVPLMKYIIPYIKKYMLQNNYDRPENLNEFFFKNHMKTQFTRQGINYIIDKYAKLARERAPELIPKKFSPHKMRHTTAMELLASNVDLIYIRDLLGHQSVSTTEIYAKTDTKNKRKVIEAASKKIVPPENPKWENSSNLKDWLKSLNRRR